MTELKFPRDRAKKAAYDRRYRTRKRKQIVDRIRAWKQAHPGYDKKYYDPDEEASYREENRERIRLRERKRYKKPKTRAARLCSGKKYRDALKQQVLTAYGGKCNCCGEIELEFLSLDHVANDGAAHRRSLGIKRKGGTRAASTIYIWAKRNGFPKTLRCLCMNCNMSAHFGNGVCAHQRKIVK